MSVFTVVLSADVVCGRCLRTLFADVDANVDADVDADVDAEVGERVRHTREK